MKSRIVLALAALLLAASPALAQRQPLNQDGVVVPHHLGKFTTQGRSTDVGGIDGDALGKGVSPFAVDDAKGPGINTRSSPDAAHSEATLGHDTEHNGILSQDSYGGLDAKKFYLRLNGTLYELAAGAALIGSDVAVADNSAVKLAQGQIGRRLVRLGFTVPGDGGLTEYNWSASDCVDADDGAQVQPTAITGCWIADFRGHLNVEQFGAKADGTTDSLTAIRAADAAASRLKVALYFTGSVGHPYVVSACINPTAYRWQGVSRVATTIKTTSATACILGMTTAAVEIADMEFGATVTRTAGAFIETETHSLKLTRLLLSSPFDGLTLKTGTISLWMDDVMVYDNSHDAIRVLDCINCQANHLNLVGNTTSVTSAGLHLLNSGDFSCFNCNIIQSFTGLRVNPGNAQTVVSLKMIGGFIDHAVADALRIDPTGTGVAARLNFTGVWFASAPVNNIIISPASTAEVSGITFNDCESYLSANGSGLAVEGGGHDIVWTGGKIAQNHAGVFITDSNYITIADSLIGATSGLLGNSFIGIAIGGTSSHVDIHGVQKLPGNGSPFVAYTATGTNNRIANNPGYNPVGFVYVTCTASPCTIVGSVNPNTVYGFGGDVVAVAQNGHNIINATGGNAWQANRGPNDPLVITYNTIPTQILVEFH